MGEIFGLFSTRDGLIRHVDQTEYTARKCLDLVTTRALDREAGALYDWVRDEWRSNHEVRTYVLQDDVIPADLEMFAVYWIEQFADLLDTRPSAEPARKTSEVGARIHSSIWAQLRGKAEVDP